MYTNNKVIASIKLSNLRLKSEEKISFKTILVQKNFFLNIKNIHQNKNLKHKKKI